MLIFTERRPKIIPRMRLKNRSDGKWTQRYSLENPIIAATARHAAPDFLNPEKKRAQDAANDERACPDGKEKSEGGSISIWKGYRSNGRTRSKSGLKSRLPKTRTKIREIIIE